MFKFSIIVPVYNVEAFLEECLLSISSQTFKDFEVILVDDGSTDRSPLICDHFQENNSNAVVIHKPNGGLVSARKAGIEKARGTYIVNIDSDDYVSSDLLSELNHVIGRFSSPDIICFSYETISENNKRIFVYNDPQKEGLYMKEDLEEIKKYLVYDTRNKHFNNGSISYSLWSKAIKKSLLLENQTIIDNSITLGEDIAVTVPSIVQSHSLYITHFVGYYYRQRNTSICHQFNRKRIESIIKVLDRLKEIETVDLNSNILSYGKLMIIGNLIQAAKSFDSYIDFVYYYKSIMNYSIIQQILRHKNRLSLYYQAIHFTIKNDYPLLLYVLYHYLRPLFQ